MEFHGLEAAETAPAGWVCRLRDASSGREIRVAARAIVNATGCWADRLPQSRVRLRLTKGIHLVLDQARFPVSEAVVMAEGSRILFAIPWGDRVILWTMTPITTDRWRTCRPAAEDVAYVLDVANRSVPPARLDARCCHHWAGCVR